MSKQQVKDLEALDREIEVLREVLNEVVIDSEASPEYVLTISEKLDKLIAGYYRREIVD
jgi:hypothetical protein